ncbi:PREDICTED: maltase 1-like [Dufourea novaeangliae]|uniref:alpha-glucosidase n=1 Tax=Dufourea novaeangliae TaxID=178035 RepID=A0A154P340_DUFNO|nr:PREDICTED: maltase 1-like [Dufourea novaeangliae]KZC06345.1 Maltase 1 [Dufourea novaeangliae]
MAPFHGRLILALGLLITCAKCGKLVEKEWWETALVYQIWPRGFQDSDGNGEGDLKGIISRLDYVKDLGVDTIWVNPIYPSPLIDSGYDISNYTDINPVFGSLKDFDELINEAHARDLKVVLDIVPNHSSDQHDWFAKSARKIYPYTDYYVWSDGSLNERRKNVPPNNWISTYSDQPGSAWTWHVTRRQWYYHKFHKSQPDLNLRNEFVLQELMGVFNFWLNRGVDGFRINSVSYLFEDKELRDESVAGTYTSELPENTDLVYRFRSYINDWVKANSTTSKLLIVESYDSDETLVKLYGNTTNEGIPPFNFRFITSIQNTSTAEHIKKVLQGWINTIPNDTSTNWVLSNHDNSRAASRIGLNRVDGLHMLSLLLPGQAYTYYGEEIAMLDRKILWNETIDPMGTSRTSKTYEIYSRDPARTPMQWNSNTSAGFSTSKKTYLPIHPDYVDSNVESQQRDKQSNLNTYKLLSSLRKNAVFTHGEYEFQTLNNDRVFILNRFLKGYSMYIVVVNLELRQEIVNLTSLYPNLEDSIEIVVASSNAVQPMKPVSAKKLILSANAAYVLKAEEKQEATTSSTTTTTDSGKNSAANSMAVLKLIISTFTVILLLTN